VNVPVAASLGLWGLWTASWVLAAVWTRQTVVRQSMLLETLHRLPTAIGGLLLIFGARVRIAGHYKTLDVTLWRLPSSAQWALVGVCALGFVFTWWARITIGDLWSSGVARKEGHVVVDQGPYALVRHPIYTGLIVSAFALGLQIGMLANLLGAFLIAAGFSLKAKFEERLLSETLGPAYADYKRRTPMLTPFWPAHR
jgi:protein-S-isoprenylcysteine O-methyltransferase Ste14